MIKEIEKNEDKENGARERKLNKIIRKQKWGRESNKSYNVSRMPLQEIENVIVENETKGIDRITDNAITKLSIKHIK